MHRLRNRFLGTTALLLAAAGEGAGGDQGNQNDQNNADGDQGAGDGATGQGQQQGGGSNGEGTEGGEGGEGEDGEGEDPPSAAVGDDEDPDLAELPPEMREKARKALERRLAKETGWRDRQIDRLHRQKRQVQEDNRALETIADPARRTQASGTAQQPGTKAFTEEDVRREAQRLTAQERYDQGCNDTDAAGRSYFGGDGWKQRTDRLAKMGGVTADDMVSILATDNPAVVLAELASDPDEYERVMGLPPARRNNEFVKLGLKSPPKKAKTEERESLRPGDNPPPPRRLQGSGRQTAAQTVNLYEDKVDDDKWYEERNKTRRKKFTNVA